MSPEILEVLKARIARAEQLADRKKQLSEVLEALKNPDQDGTSLSDGILS